MSSMDDAIPQWRTHGDDDKEDQAPEPETTAYPSKKKPIYGYEVNRDYEERDVPKYRKRTMARMGQMERATAYFKSQKHLSDEEWCAKHLLIVNKEGELVPLVLNAAQKALALEIRRQQKTMGGRVRLIILKARQLGLSTAVQALMFREILENPNETVLVLTHEKHATQKVFERTQTFADEIEKACGNSYPRKINNRKEITYDPPHRAGVYVHMAKIGGFGRGGTYRKAHLSEVAFWKDAKLNLAGVGRSVPKAANTWIIWESTANGVGGLFHDHYWNTKKRRAQAAEKGIPYDGYVELFLPWGIDPQYRIPGANLENYPADPEALEGEAILRALGYDDEQLAYRRWSIDSELGGDVDLWSQEMPATDREAFIASGRPVFTKSRVNKRLAELMERDDKRPPERMDVTPEMYPEWLSKQVRLFGPENDACTQIPERDHRGRLLVFEAPAKGRKYLISADVAQGIVVEDNEDGERGGDYSVAHVYDWQTGRQVAVWRGRIDVDLYANVLDILSRWYGRAVIAPEENNHGLAVIKALQRLNANVYMREKLDVSSTYAHLVTDRYGFQTNEKSKAVAISALVRLFRIGSITLNNTNTLKEMSTFVHHPNGAMGASRGQFDDEVMAAAIAAAILEESPPQPSTAPVAAVETNSPVYYMQKIRAKQTESQATQTIHVL